MPITHALTTDMLKPVIHIYAINNILAKILLLRFPKILELLLVAKNIIYDICIPDTASTCEILLLEKSFFVSSSISSVYPSIIPFMIDAILLLYVCSISFFIFKNILFDICNIELAEEMPILFTFSAFIVPYIF